MTKIPHNELPQEGPKDGMSEELQALFDSLTPDQRKLMNQERELPVIDSKLSDLRRTAENKVKGRLEKKRKFSA